MQLKKLHEYVEKPLMGPPSTDPKVLEHYERIYNANGMTGQRKNC